METTTSKLRLRNIAYMNNSTSSKQNVASKLETAFKKGKPLGKGEFGQTKTIATNRGTLVAKLFQNAKTKKIEEDTHTKVYKRLRQSPNKYCKLLVVRPFKTAHDKISLQRIVRTNENQNLMTVKDYKKKYCRSSGLCTADNHLRKAATCLHTHGVVHGDFHNENVLLVVDDNKKIIRAVVIDFGLSRIVKGHATPEKQTIAIRNSHKDLFGITGPQQKIFNAVIDRQGLKLEKNNLSQLALINNTQDNDNYQNLYDNYSEWVATQTLRERQINHRMMDAIRANAVRRISAVARGKKVKLRNGAFNLRQPTKKIFNDAIDRGVLQLRDDGDKYAQLYAEYRRWVARQKRNANRNKKRIRSPVK